MLEHIVNSVLEGMDERGFDAPFMALLRSAGFIDVQFTHGPLEFGKDFVAKQTRDGNLTQYVFQSKAGDLSLSQWNNLIGQLNLLRTSTLGHPSFDRSLPRQAVLILTGRLNGHAQVAAQDYAREALQRKEVPLEIWDRDRIVELMNGGLSAGLAAESSGQLLGTYGAIKSKTVTEDGLERCSRCWCAADQVATQAALSAAILALELERIDRLDLACLVGLAAVRASAMQTHGDATPNQRWLEAGELGRLIFRTAAIRLLSRAKSDALGTSAGFIRSHFEPAAMVTYRVRCVRMVEFIGLLGLMPEMAAEAHSIAGWLVSFLERHPGAWQPVSDRWAVSLVPPLLFLSRSARRPESAVFIGHAIEWLIRMHSQGQGLAGPRASAAVEVSYLFGGIKEVAPPRRDESYLATVLLDFLALFGFSHQYSESLQRVRAAGVFPCSLVTPDTQSQYLADGPGIGAQTSIAYKRDLPAPPHTAATHLAEAVRPRYLQDHGRSWDHLAVSALLRDRHFPCSWVPLVQAPP